MIEIYVTLILSGRKTLESVPEEIREQVSTELLKKLEKKEK